MLNNKIAEVLSNGNEAKNMTNLDSVNIIPNIKMGKNFNSHLMPDIIAKIDNEFLLSIFKDIPQSCRLNILLAKTVQMLSFKRIKFKEFKNEKIVNYYAICFMPSGCGKDRLINELEKHIFEKFKEEVKIFVFKYQEQRRKEIEAEVDNNPDCKNNEREKRKQVKEKLAQERNIVFEVNLATQEGFVADALAIDKLGFGCILVKNTEFGLLLNTQRTDDIAFLTMLFQAFDGTIEVKSIKGENRVKTIEELPINAILCSDPTLFHSKLGNLFDLLMQTGMMRRSFFTYINNFKKTIEEDAKIVHKATQLAYGNAEKLSMELFEIFKQIPDNSVYKLTDAAFCNVFYPYKIELDKMYNETNDSLIEKEISSRELKVLKLGCAFAALNHPKRLEIDEVDITQAINVVEYISLDYVKYSNYKPKAPDCYDKMFQFLLENIDIRFKKTRLANFASHWGFKREQFRKSFDETIETVGEIAIEQGYLLNKTVINNNTGIEIWLSKAPEINDNYNELDDII